MQVLTYSVVKLCPPLHQSVIGRESGSGSREVGQGNAHWTGAAAVQVQL